MLLAFLPNCLQVLSITKPMVVGWAKSFLIGMKLTIF